MDILFERCAGIDVHKRTVAVCRLTRDAQGIRVAETQTFGTTTGDLPRLSDWLTEGGCTHVGLESTGELWKPVFSFDAVQLSLALADEPVGLLIRLRAGRCFSADPAADEQPKTGRPRRHGAKFVCADPTT